MSDALIIIGLLALAAGVIVLIIHAIMKRPVKSWGIIAAAGFVLLIVGSVIAPSAEQFTVTSLAVAPKEVVPGESVTITASVENTSGAEGVYHAVLTIDGEETEAKSISLAAGEEEIISFKVAKNVAGIHRIELGGLADTFKVLKPGEFKASSLDITPNPVKVGEETTVRISINNVGEAEGTYAASLVVDGAIEQTEDITLAGGATGSVSFMISKDLPGSYDIEIGGQEGILRVIQPVRLSTGTFLVEKLHGGLGELTIENGLDLDAVLILSSTEEPKDPLMAVYIQSKDSYEIKGIENGTYILYYSLGEDWDSYSKEFTRNRTYKRFEDELHFTTTGSTYTTYEASLHPITGGTARTEPVGEDEFPDLG